MSMNGQEWSDGKYKKSVSFFVFNEHIATPFSEPSDSPTHLGFAGSLELSKPRTGAYQFAHIFQGGYYYHKDFNQVVFFTWKPKFELQFARIFNVHGLLGVGYAHSFPVRTTYELDDGSYVKKTNWGRPHFMPSLGSGACVDLQKWFDMPIELFVRFEAFGLGPYALKGRVPVTLNTMTGIGVKYSLK